MCYGENIGLKFNIVKPKIDRHKPYYEVGRNRFFFPVHKSYMYYLEVSTTDENNIITYYILVGKDKFNDNCRRCEVNGLGNCRIQLHDALKDYVIKECNERGNITCTLIDENSDYDTYMVM